MFERFTSEARRVLVVAQDEARNLNHRFIEPQHLLLGLLQAKGVAGRALGQLGVNLETMRTAVAETVAPSPGSARSNARELHVPFSRTAKKSLELSLREALQ